MLRRCKMKKICVMAVVIVLCFVVGSLGSAQQMNDDIAGHKVCKLCGMDRGMYDFSRMLIEYADGMLAAFCSLRCASVDLANSIDKNPKVIKVADLKGKQLIEAETAYWVVGGSKPGVMSKRGKWAFEKKDDAEGFVKVNKGEIVSYADAVKMAYEDMHDDTKAIRDRRQMTRKKMMVEAKAGAGR
jgi:copper chaperone NosL